MARESDEDEDEDGNYSWKRLPAIYTDYYEASYLPDIGMIRMAFGEYAGKGRPIFSRAAVIMPIADVKMLVETLTKWVKEAEKEEGPVAAVEAKAE